MATDVSLEQRVPPVAEAWFGYVESHPFAWRMLFQDVTGDPEIRAFHGGVRDTARSAIAALLENERSLRLPAKMIEPTAELIRSAMTGLALWWLEHPEWSRDVLVDAIVSTTWQGLASRSS
jgi:hypothetical protein